MEREASPAPSNSSSHSGDEQDEDMAKRGDASQNNQAANGDKKGNGTPASNKKDPSRPKRKKARRACFACQRAHLTCGDERPCQRCIKRGLADQCQDGARKKAKYLHDAPAEALIPGNIYSQAHGSKTTPINKSQQNGGVAPSQPPQYPNAGNMYQPQTQMMPTVSDGSFSDPSFNPFNANQSPMSSQYSGHQQTSPLVNNVTGGMQNGAPGSSHGYNPALFDSAEPNVFGFDLASMNFGNQYGALEFGMLEHMASAANDRQQRPPNQRSQSSSGNAAAHFAQQGYDGSFIGSGGPDAYVFRNDASWQPSATGMPISPFDQENADAFRRQSHAGPHAYAIGAGPGSMSGQSPVSSGTDILAMDNSNNSYLQQPAHPSAAVYGSGQRPAFPTAETTKHSTSSDEPNANYGKDVNPSASISQKLSKLRSQPFPPPSKRRRNPSSIYTAVTKPYPYTAAFHAFTAVLQRRFSPQKRLRIAQALASIRPSFISCTRNLIEEDLVFMEKCFLRGLWDYEDFSSACGTPTIVCRRTGEVAHVGKEFTLLTGWSRDVLLGKSPNMNVNIRGGNDSTWESAINSKAGTGLNTPRVANLEASTDNTPTKNNGSSKDGLARRDSKAGDEADAGNSTVPTPGRNQPVFLAELLDDDSVIQFYEDYAKLAFADSKGSAWSPCKLLKYRTKDDESKRDLPSSVNGGSDSFAATKRDDSGDKDELSSKAKKNGGASEETARHRDRAGSHPSKRKMAGPMIHAEEAMQKMGDREGKVDCVYCWMVKRDVFNIPMMIVINFLPVIN